jgi:group I intron endonuclease
MKGGIYRIVHLATGRSYVGSALAFEKRFAEHRRGLERGDHRNSRLLHAWRKYGATAFAFEILETVEDSAQLIGREQVWIDRLGAADRRCGFNLAPKAGSQLGVRHSAESRAKKSRQMLGRTLTAEHRANIGRSQRGQKKESTSATLRARWAAMSPGRRAEIAAKIAAAHLGKTVAEDVKKRISEKLRGTTLSPEHREKVGAFFRGKKLSPEHREKLKAAWVVRRSRQQVQGQSEMGK